MPSSAYTQIHSIKVSNSLRIGRAFKYGRSDFLLISSIAGLFLFAPPVSASNSSLAAWRINQKADLELRTTKEVDLKAYLDAGNSIKGPLIWIDFPGAPSRTRSIRGSGSIKEIRISSPENNVTRFTIEFVTGIEFQPSDLTIKGISANLWRLQIPRISPPSSTLGEGSFDFPKPKVSSSSTSNTSKPKSSPASIAGYAGTGMSKSQLESLCKMGMLMSMSGGSASQYIGTTLQSRYLFGNSTAQQYRNQFSWFKSHCPGL
jgi:hypothetical protein